MTPNKCSRGGKLSTIEMIAQRKKYTVEFIHRRSFTLLFAGMEKKQSSGDEGEENQHFLGSVIIENIYMQVSKEDTTNLQAKIKVTTNMTLTPANKMINFWWVQMQQ